MIAQIVYDYTRIIYPRQPISTKLFKLSPFNTHGHYILLLQKSLVYITSFKNMDGIVFKYGYKGCLVFLSKKGRKTRQPLVLKTIIIFPQRHHNFKINNMWTATYKSTDAKYIWNGNY